MLSVVYHFSQEVIVYIVLTANQGGGANPWFWSWGGGTSAPASPFPTPMLVVLCDDGSGTQDDSTHHH